MNPNLILTTTKTNKIEQVMEKPSQILSRKVKLERMEYSNLMRFWMTVEKFIFELCVEFDWNSLYYVIIRHDTVVVILSSVFLHNSLMYNPLSPKIHPQSMEISFELVLNFFRTLFELRSIYSRIHFESLS